MSIINPLAKRRAWQCWRAKTNGSCSTDSGYGNYVEVYISSAQILALGAPGSGGIRLLPSAGLSNYYDFKLLFEFKAGNNAYVGGSQLLFSNNSLLGPVDSYRTVGSGFLTGTNPGSVRVAPVSFGTGSLLTLDSADPGLTELWFSVSGAAPTAGNGTATAKIWYSIISIT